MKIAVFNPQYYLVICFIAFLGSCSPWSSETERALDWAGDNRTELEKVLLHYNENKADSLKLRAAEYLISNMVFQYSFVGRAVERLEEDYQLGYGIGPSRRYDYFNADSLSRKRGVANGIYDIKRVSSQFLIKQIEEAFVTYDLFDWSRDYSFDMFCEYILPYKLGHADTALWRQKVVDRYIIDLRNLYFKGKNTRIEPERYASNDSLVVQMAGASQGVVYNLSVNNELSIPVNVESNNSVKLFVDYYNENTGGVLVELFIDSISMGTFIFPSTVEVLEEDPVRLTKDFTFLVDSGKHVLRFKSLDEMIKIDLLHILHQEKYNMTSSEIKSGTYRLSNMLGSVLVDSMANLSQVRTGSADSSRTVLIKRLEEGFFQLIFKEGATNVKVLDALPDFESDQILLFDNYGTFNQQWALMSRGEKYWLRNRGTGKILSCSDEGALLQWPKDSIDERALWELNPVKDTVSAVRDTISVAIKVAQRVTSITNRFHWFGPNGKMEGLGLNHLFEYSYGTCVEETMYQTMILRSLGVASTIDFVINWADRPDGHFWSVVLDFDGSAVQNNCHHPVGFSLPWIAKMGKVYRKTNSINHNSLFIKNAANEPIPHVFSNPYFIDVTRFYTRVFDVAVPINFEWVKPGDFGYIQVFDNQQWVSIGWGERDDDSVRFVDLEQDQMFLPSLYSDDHFEPFWYPFFLDSLGSAHFFVPDTLSRCTASFNRKYPNRTVVDWLHGRVIGGKFQGANQPDFSDSVTLGIIDSSMLDPIFHTIALDSSESYKYVRYLGPDGGYCNISEMVLLDEVGDTLSGKVIGSEDSYKNEGKTIEEVFDGNVLTYFEAPKASGGWVGLELGDSSALKKIRFVTRNDGNMVEVGDTYELVYWDGAWVSLGEVVAESDSVVYDNVPQGALYLLHNNTKGKEERIFTLDEQGNQVWW